MLGGEQALPRVDQWEAKVSRFQFTPRAPNSIQRAICPKCGSLMWLTRIEPYLSDRDMRTFECDGCGHSEMITVKYRQRNAERSAWLKSLRDVHL